LQYSWQWEGARGTVLGDFGWIKKTQCFNLLVICGAIVDGWESSPPQRNAHPLGGVEQLPYSQLAWQWEGACCPILADSALIEQFVEPEGRPPWSTFLRDGDGVTRAKFVVSSFAGVGKPSLWRF
jgi:hypothetical protein